MSGTDINVNRTLECEFWSEICRFRMRELEFRQMQPFLPIVRAAFVLLILSGISFGQSLEQTEPTIIPGSEVRASIFPRTVGDPRLTEHFYSLRVGQGDLFVNLTHRNFIGDLDVFSIDGRRPLAKLTVVQSEDFREIGRVVFIRTPGEVLLRVQGRSPNDDIALYRLKFGGTALVNPFAGNLLNLERGNVAVEKRETPGQDEPPVTVSVTSAVTNESPKASISADIVEAGGTRVVEPSEGNPKESAKVEEIAPKPSDETPESGRKASSPVDSSPKVVERRLTLKIEFDDGGKLERPMSSVETVAIEKSYLVIRFANGAESRYPISSVIRFTVD